mmetsp:Transcript_35461/g.95115  ORF Transcript_35461/g.95115 Transcript_35461/m.95115 type:complete len:889 (+) Transcript_35461:379-3045(+)|eukprot:CAMPEP_0119531942 /NCGR_PEP_ID=MMETSP1344-20130328/45547_1 /TAXON_ID=236787 /ORGANISM="Florenciella parvula, Strain CCMP2471" /LENGTH=888 /DNA_ID=CAMNT_0007572317 /DNA_START=250 /DNA_END=2916 /DNA_ORIENTATION=+
MAPGVAPAPAARAASGNFSAQAKRKQSTFVGGKLVIEEPKKAKSVSQKNREKKLQAFLDKTVVQVVLGADLLLTLFMPDFWIISDPHENADDVMNVILTLGFVLFIFEIGFTYMAKPKEYNPRTFFFWMDIIGTASILIDITWFDFGLGGNAKDATTLRAARVAKLGARSSRLAKFAKMVKFYFSNETAVENDSDSAKRISNKLSQLLASRVAALVIFLIVVTPFLQTAVIDFSYDSFAMTTYQLLQTSVAADMTSAEWTDYVDEFYTFYDAKTGGTETVDMPLSLTIKGLTEAQCPDDDASNNFESEWVSSTSACEFDFGHDHALETTGHYWVRSANQVSFSHKGTIDITVDRTQGMRDEAGYSVVLITLVIMLLVGFSVSFNSSLNQLVVEPLSRIMNKLRTTAASVLDSVKSLQTDEDEDDDEGMNEADVLEIMVDKLARIVKNVMSSNMQNMIEQNRDMIDENTEQFLNQYSDTTKKDADIKKTATIRDESINVSTIDLPVAKDMICSFDFDTLALTHDQLVPCAMYMFENMHLLTEFNIDPIVFKTWIGKIRIRYKLDPQYHNWWHGVDVLHTTFRLLACAQAEAYLSKLEIFSTMVAACAHDVGHPGINNAFLVKSKNELALKYNDKSPLENMHCATLYEVVSEQDADIFGTLTDEQWHDCRKQIVECILNTDMVNHFGNVGKLQNFYEVSGEEVSNFVSAIATGAADVVVPEVFTDQVDGPKNRLLLQETFLHAADLSNPIKPLAIYQKWVSRVTEEFFAQGEQERSVGFPVSAMMDRASTNIPNMQVGFIAFIIAPLYTCLFQFFPEGMVVVAGNLVNNHHSYLDEARAGKVKDGTITQADEEKFTTQKAKFKEGLSFVPWDLLDNPTSRHLYTVATGSR